MQSAEDDRLFLAVILPALPDFLLSSDLYWPVPTDRKHPGRSSFPQLSLGNIRLAEARLKAREVDAESAALIESVDRLNSQWRSNWSRKAIMEYANRMRLWKDRLEEMLKDPSPAAFRYEVRLRTILGLLQRDMLTGPSAHEQEYLLGLDARLRAQSVEAEFVWDSVLKASFPVEEFWFLYRAIQPPGGGFHA